MHNIDTATREDRPRMLVLSHVLPYPGDAGQQRRVLYTLAALRKLFHLTFLAPVASNKIESVREKMSQLCDETILLPSKHPGNVLAKTWHRVASVVYAARTGLKRSNYLIGRVELTPERVNWAIRGKVFDCALFEYWHAHDNVTPLQDKGVPCVLDMHNVLWQSFASQLDARRYVADWLKRGLVSRYRKKEEGIWNGFDALIAITAAEEATVTSALDGSKTVFYAPMGVDTDLWAYDWQPARPPRIAYYGGLGSSHNQSDALTCYRDVMPRIWREAPDAELWIVGSNPPPMILSLRDDPRVKVTGYLEHVQDILKTMSVVVCPWSGRYGFRSRLVEVMALGVPVVASPDAVHGMDLDKAVILADEPRDFAHACLRLVRGKQLSQEQSRIAREQVEQKFGFDATYGRLAKNLMTFALQAKKARTKDRVASGRATGPFAYARRDPRS